MGRIAYLSKRGNIWWFRRRHPAIVIPSPQNPQDSGLCLDLTRKAQAKGHLVAEFLMRCVFTMFAEDVKLLPEDSFKNLLGDMVKRPKDFVPALEDLWERMDKGGYDRGLGATIKRFNGSLFKNAKALPLDADDINEIWIAAKRDWQDVEPSIFGTLVEQALDSRERSQLGAHFTPRDVAPNFYPA